MRNNRGKAFRAYLAAATALAAGGVLLPAQASAQVTTGQMRGTVRTADGAPAAGATISARNTGTNQTLTATAADNGNYTLNGLRPGTYQVTATLAGEETSEVVQVAIGQSATLDLTFGATAVPVTTSDDVIVVSGNRLVETRTSEIATNVSQEQIRVLPQTDRNFLSFAALAPGVRYNDSETDKSFTSGASTASQVNVFIDGVSLKNQLREGGVAGQQNSRGNPFGQLAVQEFRVATQNYKAEYEQAGAAIITAITKSGTNEFHGEVFGQYFDENLAEKDYIDKRENNPEPPIKRKQYGASLGGPIIKDKLFFFVAYEGNDQDRAFNVIPRGTAAQRDQIEATTGRNVEDFAGSFISPFRGDFYFGKLTFTPDDRQTFDVSFSRRQETDIQGFHDQIAYEAGENRRNKVDTYLFKHTYNGDGFLNEFNASYLEYTFNPVSLNPDLPQYEYIDVITFGGRDSTRLETQRNYTLRDDFTYNALTGHVFKAGVRVELTDIDFNNNSFVQPRYTFFDDPNNNLDFTFPAEARLGLGNSLIQSSNTQIGLYVQDDWDVTDRLQLNLGVRWDYETNGFNNDYVTPASAAAALRSLPTTFYFNPENYISTGNNRSPFAGAIAPRFGFSWDIFGDERTVIFGGAGRYYDRNNFNNTQDELSRSINPIGVFRFSADGSPRNGLPTVAWDPAYLTRDGLLALRATASTGLPELFAVKNDAKPPVNDQFSLGVRQKFGHWRASVTASYQRGRNGYTNLFATRQNDGLGNCCDTSTVVPYGYSNVLIGYDGLDTRYKALYFTLDKDYSKASGWGVNIAYTLSKAEQNGNDLFSLDGTVPDSYGWRARPGDERHRIVLSGIVDLPFGFQFSTLTQLGSGQAYQVTDATNGFDNGSLRQTAAYPEKNCIEGLFAFCEVNVTLAKKFTIFGGDELQAAIDVFNVFNNKNFSGFDGFFSGPGTLLPANAQYATDTLTLPRRIQFRVGYRF